MTVLAPSAALRVSVSGARAEILCEDPWVRGELEKDFAAHRGAASGSVGLELVLAPAPRSVKDGPAWRWRGGRFRDEGTRRLFDYGGRASAVYDFARERGVVWSPERDALRELGYLFLQSRLGWELDRRGLHRVHALAVERDGRAGLLVLPSGGGKSTTALELARRPGWRLLGDDHPLVDAATGEVLAFHGRPGLRGPAPSWARAEDISEFRRRVHGPKSLLDLGALEGRLAQRGRLAWVAVGTPPSASAGSLRALGRAGVAAALAAPMVVGAGLPQVFELLWPGTRGSAWAGLVSVAVRRTAAALRLASSVRGWNLEMGSCPQAAADLVEEADRRSRA